MKIDRRRPEDEMRECEVIFARALSPVQQKILEILQDEGPQERTNLCERLQIKETDLERDVATLRHMEIIRGELKGGKKLIRLW